MKPEDIDNYFANLKENSVVETISVRCVTRLQDNGDGGYTLWLHNSDEEMLGAISAYTDLTPEKIEEILTEDDPYENGYLGEETVTFERRKDGKWYIKPSTTFHCVQ